MTFRTIRRFVLGLFLAALCCGIVLYLMILSPSVQRYGLDRVSQEIGYDLKTGKIRLHIGIFPGIHVQDIQVGTKQGKVLLSASELNLIPNLFDFFLSEEGTFFSGSIEANNLKFQLSGAHGVKDYSLPQVDFQGKYDINTRLLQIASLKITTPETSLSANGHVQLSPTASPYLDLSVTSPFMAIDTLKSLLPTPLLPEWIDHKLLPVIRQGDMRIDTFSLRGNLQEIQTLNQPEHASVLGLKLTFRKMVLQQPVKNAPEIRDVSCALNLEGGVFSLDGLSGNLWQSSFQNASIAISDTYADCLQYMIETDASLTASDVNHLKTLPWLPADVQLKLQDLQVIDGTATVHISAAYETGRAFPEIITAAVSMQSIQVIHPLLRLPLTIETASIESVPGQPLKFSGRGLWGKTDFEIQGAAGSQRENVSARATFLADVRELVESGLVPAASGDWESNPRVQVVCQGDYTLNTRRLQITSLKIITPETSLSANGHVRLNPTASPYLDLTVTSPFMAIDTFKTLLPTPLLPGWISHELLPAIRQGDIRVDAFSLKGNLQEIQTVNQPEHASVLGLKLTLHNLALLHPARNAPALRDVSCTLNLNGGVFSLDGLSGNFWQSSFQNSSFNIPDTYADRLRYLIKTDARLTVSDVNRLKTLPWLPADVQQKLQNLQVIDGTATVHISAEYETGQPFPKITAGAISMQSIQVMHPLLRLPLTIENATIDSTAYQSFHFSGRGHWGKSQFQTTGSIDGNMRHLSARSATRADVGELIALALPHASVGKWIYGPLVAEGTLDDAGVTLDPAKIDVGKGYLRFKGRQAYHSEAGMHWINHIHIVQEPARNLFELVKSGPDLLDGSVSLEGVLTLNKSDGTGEFSGLNGHVRLLVEKGWIHQTDPILYALSLISLDQIFKPGSPGFQNGRLYFDRIDGEIEIDKGKILVRNLVFLSPAINASGAGTIDLNSNRIQMRIGLQPLKMMDSIVSRIPLIGNILTGNNNSLIEYSLEVTGSLSHPRIENVPLKNMDKSALGYIERMLSTPERLLNSLLEKKDPLPQVPDYHAEFDRMTIGR
jgi:hypothetical protein